MVGTDAYQCPTKKYPRGRGPEPTQAVADTSKEELAGEEEKLKESDLADQETQALWESQEIGITSWSGASGTRYTDPD